jgi:hypothetical protein
MSIWADIHRRSNGLQERKEDRIDESPYATRADIQPITFAGVVNTQSQLPQSTAVGNIFYVKDTGELFLYTNNGFELISSVTTCDKVDSNVNSIDDSIGQPIKPIEPAIVSVETKNGIYYETIFREHNYQGPQDI